MIKRLSIKNIDEVNELMRGPEIYPYISDDGCPAREEFDATKSLENRDNWWIGWFEHGALVGLWLAKPWNSVTYHVHICISSLYRGKALVEATQDGIKWMFMSSKCRKLLGLVPDSNKRMKIVMKALGFDREGKLKRSFMKDGKLIDEVIYGLCKGGGE